MLCLGPKRELTLYRRYPHHVKILNLRDMGQWILKFGTMIACLAGDEGSGSSQSWSSPVVPGLIEDSSGVSLHFSSAKRYSDIDARVVAAALQCEANIKARRYRR